MESKSLSTRHLAPGHQYPEASTKESVNEKGPLRPFLNVYLEEINDFYGFPTQDVRFYKVNEEREKLG